MSVKAVAGALGLGWDLVNSLALKAARSLVYDNPIHLQGVRVLGVDEHCWKHLRGQGEPSFATVMDPFYVVQLAGEKLTSCRQRLQQQIHGHRGRREDLLYRGRRTLLTRRSLLTDRQHDRLDRLWDAHDDHAALQVTYLVHQDIIDAYQHPGRRTGRQLAVTLIDKLRRGLPTGLQEVAQLGRTLWRKREQILAFFNKAGASNGPVEAVNGRLEHLRGIALGFRNCSHYVLRCLIHSGQLANRIHAL